MARVRHPDGHIVGAAFAIDGYHVVTCAHVVMDGGAEGPGDSVQVEFPLLRKNCRGEVLKEGWAPPSGDQPTTGDTAILQLDDPPVAIQAVPLISRRSVGGREFTAYGFPDGYDDGIPVEGELRGAVGHEWVKLDAGWVRSPAEGFSGGAVWAEIDAAARPSAPLRAVVAMIVRRDRARASREAFAVPVSVLAERSQLVADALMTPLDLDPDREIHWGPRSRGVDGDSDEAGWLFTGRRRALHELNRWLESKAEPRLRVITGAPGCGKSAIIARLVTTTDRHYRRRIRDLDPNDPTVPKAGMVDVTYHAGGRKAADFVKHVALVLELDAVTPAELLAALDTRGLHPVLAVDAVDESDQPKKLARLLHDLARSGSRVLVATRRNLLAELGDPTPLPADEVPYLDRNDVESYVRRLLAAPDTTPKYTDADVRDLVYAADGNFLVAQLTARAIGLRGRVERPFPRLVRQAFDRYIDALRNPQRVRDLLLPLAYSRGDGLPADALWLSAVAALRKRYTLADIDDLLSSRAGTFLVTRLDAPGGRRHRLFHAALADTLTDRRDVDQDKRKLWEAWLDLVRRGGEGEPVWTTAPHYLRAHGADHAAAAGSLPDLLETPDYLLVGDLDRLAACIGPNPEMLLLAQHAALLRVAAPRTGQLPSHTRSTTLALGACHLGLPHLAKRLAMAGRPEWSALWAHDLGHPHQSLSGHRGGVRCVTVGRVEGHDVIVSGGEDGVMRIWPNGAQDGKSFDLPHTGAVVAVAIAHLQGREVVLSLDTQGVVRVWDGIDELQNLPMKRRRARSATKTGMEPTTDRFFGFGQLDGRPAVLSISTDGITRVWDATDGRRVMAVEPSKMRAQSAVVGRVGKRDVFAIGYADGSVTIWDPASGDRPIGSARYSTTPVTHVALGQAGSGNLPVVVGGLEQLRVWRMTGEQFLLGPSIGADCLAVGRLGGRSVVVSGSKNYDNTVEIWDTQSGGLIGQLVADSRRVRSVAIGRIGWREVIVSGGSSYAMQVWYPMVGEPVGEPLVGHSDRVEAIAVGPFNDSDVVVSGGSDGTVRIWDAAGGRPLAEPFRGHRGRVRSVAVGRYGGRDVIISGGSDGKALIWDPITGRRKRVHGQERPVSTAVACGHLGNRDVLVTGTSDGILERWNVTGRRPTSHRFIGDLEPLSSVAIGEVGRHEAIVSGHVDGRALLWDITKMAEDPGKTVGRVLLGHSGGVLSVAIAHISDRDLVVTGGADGTVRIWDHRTFTTMGKPLTGHSGAVTSVVAGRVGGHEVIVSGSADGTVRVWDAARRQCSYVIELLADVNAVAIDPIMNRLFVASGHAICAFRWHAHPALVARWQRRFTALSGTEQRN